VDQREAEALFLNSGPAETDYGKNSGCPPLSIRQNKCLVFFDRQSLVTIGGGGGVDNKRMDPAKETAKLNMKIHQHLRLIGILFLFGRLNSLWDLPIDFSSLFIIFSVYELK
jgi:hypothetical protein